MKHVVIAMASVIICAATAPTPAVACRNASEGRPLLHRSLETVGNAEFVAEIEILDYPWAPSRILISARVLSISRGSYPGSEITIEIWGTSSCDSNPATGRRGLIAGSIRQISERGIVIDAIRAPSRRPDE